MVIDFHTHIFPDKIAKRTIEALSSSASIPPHSNGALSGLMESMEKNGIDISVNLPVLTKATQFESIFNFTKELNEIPYTGAKIISFAGMHPDISDYEKCLDMIKDAGFKGIKLHPDYQGTFIDDDRYVNILKYAKKLDLITITHAGLDGAFIGEPIKCTPTRVAYLLDRLGGYDKLVLAHLGANELFDEFYSTLAGCDIYIDTSYVLPFIPRDKFEAILNKHGEDRILFATDSPWQDQGNMVSILKDLLKGTDLEDRIFYQNAKNLLNI